MSALQDRWRTATSMRPAVCRLKPGSSHADTSRVGIIGNHLRARERTPARSGARYASCGGVAAALAVFGWFVCLLLPAVANAGDASFITITSPTNGSIWRGGTAAPAITWNSDASGGGRVFNIDTSCDNGVTWKTIGTTPNSDTRSWPWTRTYADSTQCKVRVIQPSNGVNGVATVTIDSRPPAHATGAEAIAANGTVSLSWTNPADVDFAGVRIYRSTSPATLGALVKTVLKADAPNNSWTDSGLTNGTTYYYHLVTYDTVTAAGPNAEETATDTDAGFTTARYGAGVATNGVKLWSFGGFSGAYTNDVWEFEPGPNKFSAKAATLPTGRSYARAVYVGGVINKVYVMGGYDGVSPLSDVRKFDPTTGIMSAAGTLPAARTWGAAAYAPNVGRIYYLGGMSRTSAGATYYDSIYEFNPSTDSGSVLTAVLPQPLGKSSAVYWPPTGCIYLFGGMTTGDVETNKIVRFCPSSPSGGGGTVTTLSGTLLANESEVAAVATSTGIDLIGGVSAGVPLNTVDGYIPTDDRVVRHGMTLGAAASYQVPSEQVGGMTVGLARNPTSLFPTRIFPGSGPLWGTPGVDAAAPTPNPPTPSAVANSPNQITWTTAVAVDASPGLAYHSYSFDNGATWVGSRSYFETGLNANTQYTRTVVTRDSLDNRTTGAPVSKYTLTNPPTGASGTGGWDATDGYKVTLTWSAPVGGASSYVVRWGQDAYASVQGSTAGLTFTQPNLAANTTYAFRICGVNPDGAEETTCAGPVLVTTPPALAWLTGIETGSVSDGNGGGGFDGATCPGPSALSADAVVRRSGSYSMKAAPNGGACYASLNPVAGTAVIARFALRFPSLPAADSTLFSQRVSAGNDFRLNFNAASGKLQAAIGGATQLATTPALPNVWYVVNLRALVGSNPRTLEWQIDGISEATVSSAEAASTMGQTRWGTSAADTYTAYFDDLATSYTTTDYPIGYGKVIGLRPDGPGASNNPGDFFNDDLTALDALSWQRIDDSPLGPGTSDFVTQVAPNPASYAEFTLANTSVPDSARAVRGITFVHRGAEAGGPISNGMATLRRSDGTETSLQPVAGADWSTYPSLPSYDANMVSVPAGGWTQAQVNALTARVGHATDVGPTPRWDGVMAEVEYGDFAPQAPLALAQYRDDGFTSISTGGWTADGSSNNVVLRFDLRDMDNAQTLTPWVEVRPFGTPFSAICGSNVAGVTFSGTDVVAPTAGTTYTATVNVTGLSRGVRYVWRACSLDQDGVRGAWTSNGGSPDFIVSDAPSVPALVSPPNNDIQTGTTATLTATFSDPDTGDAGRVNFQICADATCSAGGDPVASGSSSAGLANGADGSWSSGSLTAGQYYWRAQNMDQSGLTSAWSATRALTVGLTVTLDVTGCGGSSTVFDAALPGTSSVTQSECTIGYSTTLGVAKLRIFQQDGVGRAMTGPTTILDYGEPGGSWGGTSMFGACLKTSTNTTDTWTPGACGTSDGAWWNGVGTSPDQISTAAAGASAQVGLHFGLKTPAGASMGSYSSSLTVEVIAP